MFKFLLYPRHCVTDLGGGENGGEDKCESSRPLLKGRI